jgi:hypothetical protein
VQVVIAKENLNGNGCCQHVLGSISSHVSLNAIINVLTEEGLEVAYSMHKF